MLPWGIWGEVYKCPRHADPECEMCGGGGYRSVCNKTACHEYGCQGGSCSSDKDAFEIQQAIRGRA